MKLTKNLGMLLLAVWLIVHAVVSMAGIGLPKAVLAIIALLAGVFVVLFDESLRVRLNRHLGLLLLGIWLLVHGVLSLFTIDLPGVVYVLLPILLLVAGVLILLFDESYHLKLNKSVGMVLLGIVAVVLPVITLFNLVGPVYHYGYETFALITGIVLLFEKPKASA